MGIAAVHCSSLERRRTEHLNSSSPTDPLPSVSYCLKTSSRNSSSTMRPTSRRASWSCSLPSASASLSAPDLTVSVLGRTCEVQHPVYTTQVGGAEVICTRTFLLSKIRFNSMSSFLRMQQRICAWISLNKAVSAPARDKILQFLDFTNHSNADQLADAEACTP
jgi:hypothetical protein